MRHDWAAKLLDEVITSFEHVEWEHEVLHAEWKRIADELGVKYRLADGPGARRRQRALRRPAAVRVPRAARPRRDAAPVARGQGSDRAVGRVDTDGRRHPRRPDQADPAVRAAGAGRCGSPAAVIVAVLGYFAVSYLQVWSTGRSDQARPVDAIVVMGAAQYDGDPSPQLAARLDHVAELWPQGLAPLVVVTGGNRPGDRFTEAAGVGGLPGRARRSRRGDPARGRRDDELRVAARRRRAARPARSRRRAHRDRPVPRPAQPADRRGAGPTGARVTDARQRRHGGLRARPPAAKRPPAWRSAGSSGSPDLTPAPSALCGLGATSRTRPLHSRTAPWGVV